MSKTRGAALGLVLTVVGLALLAVMVAAAITTSNLAVTTRVSNNARAQDLANSVVAEATARLLDDYNFADEVRFENRPDFPEGARGYLTFDRTQGGPFSTNNFASGNDDGWQRSVATGDIHLVGMGECGGVRRYVEVLVHVPLYPVTVASDGQVELRNTLIASLKDTSELSWNSSGLDYDDDALGPAELTTNSDASQAVVLDSGTRVTGNVQARGGVAVNGATIEGEVRSPWPVKARMPDINIKDYDPEATPHNYFEKLPTGRLGSQTVVGIVRADGDVHVAGNLELDNALVYVEGNLEVEGAVRGVGAVCVEGSTTFAGGALVNTDDVVAVLSQGDLTLEGSDMSTNLFQGLLYTRGNFRAVRVTVVGAFVADADGTTGGGVYVEDSRMLHVNSSVQPEFVRETYAVVPRFAANAGDSEIREEPNLKFKFGQWGARNTMNVLEPGYPGYSHSVWSTGDPAVIRARLIGGATEYTYFWRGRPNNALGTIGPTTDREVFVQAVALANSSNGNGSGDVLSHLHGTPPDPTIHAANLRATLDRLEFPNAGLPAPNFNFDPNRFLDSGDRVRVKYRREFSL